MSLIIIRRKTRRRKKISPFCQSLCKNSISYDPSCSLFIIHHSSLLVFFTWDWTTPLSLTSNKSSCTGASVFCLHEEKVWSYFWTGAVCLVWTFGAKWWLSPKAWLWDGCGICWVSAETLASVLVLISSVFTRRFELCVHQVWIL